METQTQVSTPKSTPPILVIAAIAVVIFSATGTAAIMGWLPTSSGSTNDNAAETEQHSQDTQKSQESAAKSSPTSSQKPAISARKPAAAVKVAAAPVKTVCIDCGVIESITAVKTRGEGSGLGAVGGAVVGGLVGNQFGGGDGKKVTTAAGVIGGALAGHQIEKEVKATQSYAVTVRLENGSTKVFSVATAPSWQAGDKVRIVNGEIQAL